LAARSSNWTFDTGQHPYSGKKNAQAKNTQVVGQRDQHRATMMMPRSAKARDRIFSIEVPIRLQDTPRRHA
jgi:predicted RNase H-like nuclease